MTGESYTWHLKNDKRIRTQSMGNGSLRKLVIFPKKNAFKKK